MDETEAMHRLKDVANAAGTLLQAIEEAPNRVLEGVDAVVSGPATVVIDDDAADVVLHEDGVTIHLRRE